MVYRERVERIKKERQGRKSERQERRVGDGAGDWS